MDRHQQYLAQSGVDLHEVDGVWWQNYKRVLLPAYLPHLVPDISPRSAKRALGSSSALMARWTSQFDTDDASKWWFVLRDGDYGRSELSSNTRSKISRGRRRLSVGLIGAEEVLAHGYAVCRAAVRSYGRAEFLPSEADFSRRIEASAIFDGAVDYFGVYNEAGLVAFSENLIQDDAVFLESIWYDPVGLRDYSSYVLIDAVLDEYLVRRKYKYVSDGSRSIYHETGVHDFLIEKFGFRRASAKMHLCYSPRMSAAISIARPFGSLIGRASIVNRFAGARRVAALLLQDSLSSSWFS